MTMTATTTEKSKLDYVRFKEFPEFENLEIGFRRGAHYTLTSYNNAITLFRLTIGDYTAIRDECNLAIESLIEKGGAA
jgi:basic membrane lipoprotein Med (substrate-binding protein (PBP1-ABC) superfamily)